MYTDVTGVLWFVLLILFFFFIGSSRIEVAYQEAVALKRQEELIREEEAAGLADDLKGKRAVADREKRAKKKQVCRRKIYLFYRVPF